MDIDKTIQFILETQAKHEAAIQQSDERYARFREQTEERFKTLVDTSLSLAHYLEALAQRVEETRASVEETRASVTELRESQVHSDARMDGLANITRDLVQTVDKLVKRNGKP
ncbi:MAG TPA: hypothetical protein VFZ08_10085 [Terriglobia bacterium]|nr:hypothetical protein [Terriglobia bacterium]